MRGTGSRHLGVVSAAPIPLDHSEYLQYSSGLRETGSLETPRDLTGNHFSPVSLFELAQLDGHRLLFPTGEDLQSDTVTWALSRNQSRKRVILVDARSINL